MEGLAVTPDFWRGKRVFVTGHTGFKGGWLALWLNELGASVYGFALQPPTAPNFFSVCQVEALCDGHAVGDVRDAVAMLNAMRAAAPDVVLHLAAQSLVGYSYASPVETYAVNVMGTVNLLEAVRQVTSVKAVVVVTSDKCYQNLETATPHRESDTMGGHDPYSSSKGCTELVTAAYRASFLSAMGVHVASARAGNVIGGGDWALNRLIPDFFRALDNGQSLLIRAPNAIRPWQHVLEPLSGYLELAERLLIDGSQFAEAWNFGSDDRDAKSVQWIVEHLCGLLPAATWRIDGAPHSHEAHTLKLDSAKAAALLGWRPRWALETALQHTLSWRHAWRSGDDMAKHSRLQVRAHHMAAASG